MKFWISLVCNNEACNATHYHIIFNIKPAYLVRYLVKNQEVSPSSIRGEIPPGITQVSHEVAKYLRLFLGSLQDMNILRLALIFLTL